MGRKATCDCGECAKCKRRIYMRNWYQGKTPEERKAWVGRRDHEKIKAADRTRYERDKPKRRAANAAYTQVHPEEVAAYKRAWAERNPEKRKAHIAVGNAVRSGKLVRQPCEKCGSTGRVHAHHDDYSKPLEVRWLCPRHHADERRS